jgi:hypothetical protein
MGSVLASLAIVAVAATGWAAPAEHSSPALLHPKKARYFRRYLDPDWHPPYRFGNSGTETRIRGSGEIHSDGEIWDPHAQVRLRESHWPYPEALGESLTTAAGTQFHLVNVGFAQIERHDGPLEQAALARARAAHPGASLRLLSRGTNLLARETLHIHLNTAQYATSRLYYATKGYLRDQDFYDLQVANVNSMNSDFFVLLSGRPKDLAALKYGEFERRMVATVQYTRWEDYHNKLPCMTRGRGPVKREARAKLQSLSQTRKLRELMRFGMFQRYPAGVRASMLLRVFELAKREDAILIASLDQDTRKSLGLKYRFSDFLPGRENDREMLMQLDTRSPDYDLLIADLRAQAQGVDARAVTPPRRPSPKILEKIRVLDGDADSSAAEIFKRDSVLPDAP